MTTATEVTHLVALLDVSTPDTGRVHAALGFATLDVSELLADVAEHGPAAPIWCVYEYPTAKIVYSNDPRMVVGEYVDFGG